MIKVGKPAPDFAAAGYHQGKFANFNLSGYKGNGFYYASIQEISPLFEQLKFQQLLKNTKN